MLRFRHYFAVAYTPRRSLSVIYARYFSLMSYYYAVDDDEDTFIRR